MTTNPNAPAYPEQAIPMDYGNGWIRASDKTGQFGLTKREFIAAIAMQGLLANEAPGWQGTPDNNAKAAATQADALIAALNREVSK